MRKMMLAGVATFGILLSGCQNAGDKTKTVLTQTQQIAVQVCGFMPTIDTVLNIVALNNPLMQSAEQIGKAICQAVGPAPFSRPGAPRIARPAEIAGVTVTGVYVK